MAKSLICDHCDTKAVEQYALGWLIIEEIGMSTRMMGQTTLIGKTFCSAKCLTRFLYEGGHHGYDNE